MPSIDIYYMRKYLQNDNISDEYPVFVETGTYKGETILSLENYFHELHTIEIKRELFEMTRRKSKKINFHLGDSSIVLSKICKDIKSNTIFFLDGHWSCGITGKGEKDIPLYEELNSILTFFKNKCIIIIDDCRLFGKGPNKQNENYDECNWEEITLEKIINMTQHKMEKYYFCPSKMHEKDRLIIFLNK